MVGGRHNFKRLNSCECTKGTKPYSDRLQERAFCISGLVLKGTLLLHSSAVPLSGAGEGHAVPGND